MGRDQGPQIDVAGTRAALEIEDEQQMARVGIAAVDAVAEDRHVGDAGFRQHQQLVHGARKAVEHDLGLVADRIEEQDLRPHLVDPDQPSCTVGAGYHAAASLVAWMSRPILGARPDYRG